MNQEQRDSIFGARLSMDEMYGQTLDLCCEVAKPTPATALVCVKLFKPKGYARGQPYLFKEICS